MHQNENQQGVDFFAKVMAGLVGVAILMLFIIVGLANRGADKTPYFEKNYALSCKTENDTFQINYVWREELATVWVDETEFWGDVIARGQEPRNSVPLDSIWFFDIQRIAPNSKIDREFFQVMNDRNNVHLMMDRPCAIEFLQRMPNSVKVQGYDLSK